MKPAEIAPAEVCVTTLLASAVASMAITVPSVNTKLSWVKRNEANYSE